MTPEQMRRYDLHVAWCTARDLGTTAYRKIADLKPVVSDELGVSA